MTIGWGTMSYAFAAGACAVVAMVFFLIGGRLRRVDSVMLSFGLFSLTSAVYAVVTVRLHLSQTIEEYSRALEAFGLASLVMLISMMVLVAAWTKAVPRTVMIVWLLLTVVIGAFQVALPNGLLAGEITGLRVVSLFGEQFVVHQAPRSAWRPVLDLYLVVTSLIVIVALVRGYLSTARTRAALVSGGFAVVIMVSLWDGFVDTGDVGTPYLSPFAFLVMSISGAAYLAERSVQTDRQLRDQTSELEEIVIDRTSALLESNRRLERQLARQRGTAHNLSTLATQFESSNALLEPGHADIEKSLRGLLQLLGELLPATVVELRIDSDRFDKIVPREVAWRARDVDHGADDPNPFELAEPIRMRGRSIGEILAHPVDGFIAAPDEPPYIELVAEHLSGVFHRLELVDQIAVSAVEDERQRIAMDLHDSVTQRLYSVSFLAEAAAHMAEADPTSAADALRRVRELVLGSLAELRSLLFELRPQALNDNLLDALVEQLVTTVASTSKIDVVTELSTVPPMPAEVRLGLYRIAQEALSNACRHSGAERVRIRLDHADGVTTLDVIDDGVGFEVSNGHTGQGLRNLKARAALIGAAVDVVSTPGTGTAIEARWVRPAPDRETVPA
jgi:signal transduction histidine kinase